MIRKIKQLTSKFWLKTGFFVLGIGSIIWFLIRVMPKPSRAQHPCMKVAAPLASSFVSYLLGLTALTLIIKKTKVLLINSRYHLALVFIALGLIAGSWTILHTNSTAKANISALQPPQAANQPIGEAKGIFPGRVVWVHDPDATDENCSNDFTDLWSDNTDQTVVSTMVKTGLKKLTGATTDIAAWDSIFHYYNRTHGRGDVGYTSGEKFAIKINLNAGDANSNINTSPQVCYAILDELVNVAGVDQADISIGDPNVYCTSVTWNACHPTFPNVRYWGNAGGGRTAVAQSDEPVFKLSSGDWQNYLPKDYVEATYMINLPVFKKHHRAGISLCCKNHFGSIAAFTGGAWHLHPYLPCPEASGVAVNGDYGVYRVFVDIMGHKDLGGKTILYLIDGLWSSVNWGHPPIKWEMSPFNNDWPSSLFFSQDPVAIESVCFDFLYNEFDEDHPTEGSDVMSDNAGPFPHFQGTDDFLHQAADPTKWPVGFEYDPEDDGSILTSLGTHEHWNNAISKDYSRNLGTGNGIELLYVYRTTGLETESSSHLKFSNYPNPFTGFTKIQYSLDAPADVQINIFNSNGQLIKSEIIQHKSSGDYEYIWNTSSNNNTVVAAGNYFINIVATSSQGVTKATGKMTLLQ